MIDDVKPWGRWATLGLGVIALFSGQMVALITLIQWYGLSLTQLSNYLMVDGVLVSLSVSIATAVQVALLALMARQRGYGAAVYLGLTLPCKCDLVLGIIVVAIFMAAAEALSRVLGQNPVTQFQLDIYRSASAAGSLPWLWLALTVVGPIGEETLFRGFLFRGWHRFPRDSWIVIATTALLWALSHVQYQYDVFVMAQVFVYGLVLGWFRWKSGSTLLTILLHGLVNFEGLVGTAIAIHS
jgi:membrane protease YdiL (CAAX protease family)